MRVLTIKQRAQILSLLTEGMGINATARVTGFSKMTILQMTNHMHSISLSFMAYNFCKVHKTLRVTPAMQAGIADHIWTMEEVVEMSETYEHVTA